MAVTIADLEVNIRDNGQSATLALNALINTLSKLASNIEPASKALKETTKELKTVEKTADKAASGGLGKFFKSIVRIAGYRAIRSALKMITSGFREGVQNIALYSQAVGGLDANNANKVMSAYATMGLQIKNSLGAAVMPLLAQLVPYIQKVADWFMTAADAVARFFATINGQTTYTKVNTDYMVDYAKSLNKATGAAKELKRTILGFDEINALQKQPSGGGSSGNQLDYSQMFVEAENPWLKYKETFEDILQIVKWVGIAIAAWKLTSSFISGIESLLAMSKMKQFTLGLMLTIVGVGFSYDAGINAANGSIGLAVGEGIGGLLASALGGTLMGATLGHPVIGLLFGITASIISFFVGYADESAKIRAREYIAKSLGDTGLTIDNFSSDAIQAHLDVATEIRNKITDLTGLADPKTLAKLTHAKELLEQIFTLDEIEVKTPEQMAELNTLVEVFNSIGLDGIKVEFDEVTGKIKGSKEELRAMVDNLELTIKKTALLSAATEAYTQLIIAQQELNELYAKRKVLMDSLKKAMEDGDLGAISKLSGALEDVNSAIKTQENNIKTLDTRYTHFVNEAKRLTGDWKNTIDDVKKSFNFDIETTSTRSGSGTSLIRNRVMAKASGGLVPTGDLFWAGERAPELIMSAPGGSEVVNMAQFQDAMVSAVMMAGGNGGGDWTIVVQDESGAVRSRQVITAAERANRRDGRTIVPVGVQ